MKRFIHDGSRRWRVVVVAAVAILEERGGSVVLRDQGPMFLWK